jgi:DNA adenine methylase
MDSKSCKELKALCKEKGIKGYSTKNKSELLLLLSATNEIIEPTSGLEKEKEYLKEFLKTLVSKSGFKRVSLSPLRYPGGKSAAIGHILSHIPSLKSKKVVSPFFGGGSFEFVLSSILGFEVIGYDVFGILVNFWQQVLKNANAVADELAKLVPDKTNFTRNRHILLEYWEKVKPESLVYHTKEKLDLTEEEKSRLDSSPLLQAVYYYYNMQLSYGPMFLGWQSSVYLNEKRFKDIVAKIRSFTPGSVSVSCGSFEEVIPKHSDDFLFLDPPYYLGDDSKMFKGMYPNCNFAIHHNGFDHAALRDLLKKHRGGFFLTYNDCDTIREWYKEFQQEFPKWQYTYGLGETRIGKNREESGTDNKKESHEIFIICSPK